jgi:ribosomal protein L7/L12
MSRINFIKGIRTKYLGRNGYHNCQGLSVTHTQLGEDPVIFIEPINTRDEVGRARIEIPEDSDTVFELVSKLLNVPRYMVEGLVKGDPYAVERAQAKNLTDADIIAIAKDRKIQAIKMYRFKTGAGLLEAKEAVENLVAHADADEEMAKERIEHVS